MNANDYWREGNRDARSRAVDAETESEGEAGDQPAMTTTELLKHAETLDLLAMDLREEAPGADQAIRENTARACDAGASALRLAITVIDTLSVQQEISQ